MAAMVGGVVGEVVGAATTAIVRGVRATTTVGITNLITVAAIIMDRVPVYTTTITNTRSVGSAIPC